MTNYILSTQRIYNIKDPIIMETKIWHYAEYEINKVPFSTSCFETMGELVNSLKSYMSVLDNVVFKTREVKQ